MQRPVVREIMHNRNVHRPGAIGSTFADMVERGGVTLEECERIERDAERAERERVARKPYRHIRIDGAE